MRGKVVIFNAVKGLGFIEGEGGGRHFFHQTDLMVPGFRAIAVGKEVEFTDYTRDGRPVAKEIRPINGTGIQVANPLPKAINLEGIMKGRTGIVILRVDTLDRIYANEDLFPFGEFVIAPSIWGTDDSFRAFRAGGMVKGFTLRLPRPTQERVFLALDPDKTPMPSREELPIEPGSYLLSLEADGSLRIQCMGRRYQEGKGGGNWVVLEHRSRQALNLAEEIEGQLPTSGLARDNDGFVPAIKEAITLLRQKVTAS